MPPAHEPQSASETPRIGFKSLKFKSFKQLVELLQSIIENVLF